MEPISPSALAALAIFPLPDIALFPGALLPLHIFEPRYRTMTADVIAGSKLLGIVRLRPGYQADYEGRPAIFETAGLGEVMASDRLPDGRYHLMLRGVARVRIEHELPPEKAYRSAAVRVLEDNRSSRPAELAPLHQTLLGLCDQLAAALPEGGDALRQLARAYATPPATADVIAAAVVRDPELRQNLLELLDPADRLDEVIRYVTALVGQFNRDRSTLN